MRRIKLIHRNGESVPEVPLPKNDPEVVSVVFGKDECIIYERKDGENIPEQHRAKLHVLRKELSDDLELWRYIDFTKLYELISKKAIFFTPGYILRDSEPYELRIPLSVQKQIEEMRASEIGKGEIPADEAFRFFRQADKSSEHHNLYMNGISCWHVNNAESNALWKEYIKDGNGVAIKSSIARMKKSLDVHQRYICADIVQYIDYEIDCFTQHPSASGFEIYFHKSKFFEYEKEFRLVYSFKDLFPLINPQFYDGFDPEHLREMEKDISRKQSHFLRTEPYVPVDLTALIEEIVVCPYSRGGFTDLVTDLVSKELGASAKDKIRPSKVNRWPSDDRQIVAPNPAQLKR